MEFSEVVRRRRMVRNFAPDPLPEAVVDRIIDHALRAPSAGFSQGWAFLVLDAAADITRFWDAVFPEPDRDSFRWQGLFAAPLVIVPLSHKRAYLDRYAEGDKGWADRDESRWPVPYWDIDTGFAALLILLTAVDEGLGALFFGVFPERMAPFRSAFTVPDAYTPIGAIAVGYALPDEPSPSLQRGWRGRNSVVFRGSFGHSREQL